MISEFIMPFGKHKNKKLIDIYIEEESYLRWLLREFENKNNKFSKELCYAINKTFNPNYEYKEKKLVLFDNTYLDKECPF